MDYNADQWVTDHPKHTLFENHSKSLALEVHF